MDVIKEMQEMRAMKAQVEELAKQGMDPKDLNQKLQLPRKEWESDLAWKTRVLTLSYASDFIDAAEAKNIQLTFQPEEAEAVAQAVSFYKLAPDHVIVVSDEVALPIGKLRIRTKGSAGGHNGLKNIIALLGTDQFPRIRIGVGAAPHPDYDMADWVLSSFKGKDAEDILAAAARAAEAVECYITKGADRAMNLYN